jgi:hypothetical protein
MLFILALGIGLIPGIVLADSHGHHGGHGHGHHDGWGHSSVGISFGFGSYWPGPYYYPYYPAPSVVYVEPPASRPAAKAAPAHDADMDKFLKSLKKDRFCDRLQHGDKSQKLQAMNMLAEFSSDDQVRAAIENTLQSDPDASIRKAAIEMVGRFKNQKSIGVLEKVKASDTDLEVRQAAEMAIKQIQS